MSRFLIRLKLALVWLSLSLSPIEAQEQSNQIVLIADSVFLSGDNILTATGNVEAITGETRMQAESLTYNAVNDSITIEGPIQITDGTSVALYAAFAELDADLQNGLLRSAQLVLDQQVRLTAQSIRRIGGSTSELDQVRVVSCKVCHEDETPLWYIRARKVRHDEAEQRLYLDEAQLRVFDVPVFYLPRLSLPDPTVERATGFLIPSLTQRTDIGTAIRVPYFITLGDHRDIRLAPYVSVNMTTLEARYRQAFRRGDIVVEGAVSQDDFSGYSSRAFLFANGAFDIARDYKLTFQVQMTSDESYLADYDYSSIERLNSGIAVSRADRTENTRVSFNFFRTLRDTEDNETIPSVIFSARKQKRLYPSTIGGEALWELEFHTHSRISEVDTDANNDGIVDGRDVTRLNAELEWRRSWRHSAGIEFGALANLALDAVYTSQDSTVSEERFVEMTPSVAFNMRYPLLRQSANGTTHVLEPIAQLGWSGGAMRSGTAQDEIANDESTRTEFDEGNLLSLSRFSSDDRRERALSFAYGLNYARYGAEWSTRLTFGQVIRDEDQPDFSSSSGLNGVYSDYLLAGQLSNRAGLRFSSRVLVDLEKGLNKAEAIAGWHNDVLAIDGSYVWLDEDPQEDRAEVIAELNLDTEYRFSRHWTALANWRYDVAANSTSEAGFGLEYQNECVKAQFSVSRRFTSSTNVDPATDLSFTVELLGFSARTRDKSFTKQCSTTAG